MTFLRETRFKVTLFGIAGMLLLVLWMPLSTDASTGVDAVTTTIAGPTVGSVDSPCEDRPGALVIDNADQLMAAMVEGNTNQNICINAGTYEVSQRLFAYGFVEGEGVMGYDGHTPTGFLSGITLIKDIGVPAPTVYPDYDEFGSLEISAGVMELGDGAVLRGVMVDASGGSRHQSGLHVRGSFGSHSVTIDEVESVGQGVGRGGGITVFSAAPGESLKVGISRSVLRGNGSHAIRVINGGNATRIKLNLTELHTITGTTRSGLLVVAGLNHGETDQRPQGADNTKSTIVSTRNLWEGNEDECGLGWNMLILDGAAGGANPPLAERDDLTGTNNSKVFAMSVDDHFLNFGTTARGRVFIRSNPEPGTDVNNNRIDLELLDFRSDPPAHCGSADFMLIAYETQGAVGNNNRVDMFARGVVSGGFSVEETETFCPEGVDFCGSDNRTKFVGLISDH